MLVHVISHASVQKTLIITNNMSGVFVSYCSYLWVVSVRVSTISFILLKCTTACVERKLYSFLYVENSKTI